MRIIIFVLLAAAWGLWIFLSEEKKRLTFVSRILLCLCLFLWGGLLCHQWGALTLVKVNNKWKFVAPYALSHKVPPRNIVKESWRVLEKIQRLPGTVYIPHHNYYAWLIGKSVFYPVDTIRDLTIGRGIKMIPGNFLKALDERRFDFIILNDQIGRDWLDNPIRDAIQGNYEQMENMETMGWNLLRPVDATAMKPRFIWRRKDWKDKNPSHASPAP